MCDMIVESFIIVSRACAIIRIREYKNSIVSMIEFNVYPFD